MKRFICVMLCALLILPALAEDAVGALAVSEALEAGESEMVYGLFDETMRAAMTVDALAAVLPQLKAANGKLLQFGGEETTSTGPYVISTIRVSFEKGDLLLAVTFLNGKIAGMYFSPIAREKTAEYEVPQGLMEEDFSVGDPALPGTLTLPVGASSPLPAVVLLHGSGPNDRDESIGQTKMFRDLAEMLAEKGIAVLRYDKRTLVYGGSYTQADLKTFTVDEESIRDAVAAAELLRSDPRISQVFLVGHSMGAIIAPRIAQENPGLFDGIILLSGTPKTLGEIVLSQNQALVDALPPLTKAIGQIQMQGLRMEWNNLLNSTEEEAKNKTVFGQPAYYFWEMAQYDTGEILQALDIPVLIINGGRDFQVVDADGIDAWNALNLPDNVQVCYYPELNHLLMDPDAPEEARGTVKEYDTPCHVSQEIIAEIAEFILK